jgi:hypothetical protein
MLQEDKKQRLHNNAFRKLFYFVGIGIVVIVVRGSEDVTS